jgi:uncharacterized RDD family membrane protein YckC
MDGNDKKRKDDRAGRFVVDYAVWSVRALSSPLFLVIASVITSNNPASIFSFSLYSHY